MVGFIRRALELNGLRPSLYVEPFVGGASVALQLMEDGLVEQVVLIDRDPWIASFWQTVFRDTKWLVEQILSIEVTLERWQHFKASEPSSVREQALTAFFLNRTSFSGILESRAGPLGGMAQESDYPIDCRFPRDRLVQRIERAAEHSDKVLDVWSCSWDEALRCIRTEQRDNRLPSDHVFYYFDPPFFEKADALYRYAFNDQDHIALRDELLTLDDSWMLSYDSAEGVQRLYGCALRERVNGTQKHNVRLPYSVAVMAKRRKVEEVIITNLPQLPSDSSDP